MNTEIVDAYRREYAWSCARMGKPSRIYLGEKEYLAFKGGAERFCVVPGKRDHLQRPEWCGMPIFRVDADTHISFGWDEVKPECAT